MKYLLKFFWFISFKVLSSKIEGGKDEAQVQVRAVFLNCDPDEKENTLAFNQMARFEQEELFKHSVLRDCSKKLGLSVKLASDSKNDPGDVYIPIDHVLYGPNKKHLRLLNPYVLRLQWDTPLQAYKLRRIDTVSGTLSSDESQQKEDHGTGRHRRESHNFSQLTDSEKNKLKLSQGKLVREQCLNITDMTKRGKRQEHNIVVMHDVHTDKSQLRVTTDDYDQQMVRNRRIPSLLEDTARITTEDNLSGSNYQKYTRYIGNMDNNVRKETFHPYDRNMIMNVDKSNTNSERSIPDADVVSNPFDRNITFHDDKEEDEKQNEYVTTFATTAKDFVLYEIGNPDLWQTVRVEIYEKLSSPDGKTVWNDLMKGKKASVSSMSPDWISQDVDIHYQPAEWIPREEFSLPITSLGLLATKKTSNIDPYSDKRNPLEGTEYIVVPFEDITELGDGNNLNKRDSNYTEPLSTATIWNNLQGHRRVKIRTTRALFGNSDTNFSLQLRGIEQYLTLPYRRAHRSQIDLETRADDNQLVCAGVFGRISTVVSDNTRRTRTTLIIQATNTGLAASRFRATVRDCGPALSELFNGEEFATSSILIPPKHTRRLDLEIPFEIPVDVVHCSVALINENKEPVAIRDVAIRKDDRCFCVWHCDCVCLGEDPKLLCREMAESRQVIAGLSVRDRPRRVRSLNYSNSESVNVSVAILGMLITLLILGVFKACFGLVSPSLRSWGLTRLFKSPRKLDRYYESSLRSQSVEHDSEGWPVHPETKKRTVHLCSWQMEFMLNVLFFLIIPCVIVCDGFRELKTHFKGTDRCDDAAVFNKNTKKCFSSQDMQSKEAQYRQREAGMRRWMTPRAEKLSTDIWEKALKQDPIKRESMRPLLHDGCPNNVMSSEAQDSCLDSEQEDSEYVLMQMQRSKESLSKSQKKSNNIESNSTRKK